MPASINSKTSREKLKPRREPYWSRLRAGVFLGYRKAEEGDGTWCVRRRGEDGKQRYFALGTQPDYDTAAKAAESWASAVDAGVTERGITVAKACELYVTHLREHKSASSAKDAEGRFNRLVYGKKIGSIELAKLRTSEMRAWISTMLEVDEDEDDEDDLRRAKDSANRNLASLKAALNLALKDRLVATDAGWRTVVPFKAVGRRRQGFVPKEQRSTLLAKAPDDLRPFLEALLLTAARPGELAKVTAQHFDRIQGTLSVSGKTGFRIINLSSRPRALFEKLAEGKAGEDFLFVTEYGQPWIKDRWKKVFRQAVSDAGLPDATVMYSLRHTAISEMIAGGMDPFSVATMAGTSTAMIDKHYGHLRHDRTRELLDTIAIL